MNQYYDRHIRDKKLATVRLLPEGWVTQAENQGNYRLGSSVDQTNAQEPSLSESALEHKNKLKQDSNLELDKTLVESYLENKDTPEDKNKVFGSPEGHHPKDSDQHSELNSICNLPHISTDKDKYPALNEVKILSLSSLLTLL